MTLVTSVDLPALARHYRRALFEKFLVTQQGHPGGALSMVDIAVTLYHGGFVRRDADGKGLHDRVIVSKGHGAVALYPILVGLGILDRAEWDAWGEHPSCLRVFGNRAIPGMDATTGSLGHGLGYGTGMALSAQRQGIDRRVFVIMSEGELYEGSTWEALLLAAHLQLSNLVLVIDCNDLIILGPPNACVTLEPLDARLRGFGLAPITCDGHDIDALSDALRTCTTPQTGPPGCIIARTVKGKGLSLMEGQPRWHYWNTITDAEIAQCRQELA